MSKENFYKTLNDIVGNERLSNEEAYIINDYVSHLEMEYTKLKNAIKKYKKWLKQMSEYDSKLRGTENDRYIYSNCKDYLEHLLIKKINGNKLEKVYFEEFDLKGSDSSE